MPAFSIGKWIQEASDELYELIAKRTQQPDHKHKIHFNTDGNSQNENAILKYFNKDCVTLGHKVRDKIDGKIIGIHKRKVIGNPAYDKIGITHIDGLCSKFRARLGCLVRRTRNFPKQRRGLKKLLNIMQTNQNFVEHKKGITPAMKEKITDKILPWEKILSMRLSFKI
jgi:hypothetical protein